MELQTLRNFIEIADHGSITAAARTLGISQPGLSRQLKDLEKSWASSCSFGVIAASP